VVEEALGVSMRKLCLSFVCGMLGCAALGCGGGLIPARPTETVRVLGPSADALGRTIERDERGLVHVELHEGPVVWVAPERIAAAGLAVGTPVIVRDASGALFEASVVGNLDRVIWVARAGGAGELVSLDHVIAALHAPLVAATHEEVVVTPPPPPPDPRRFATRPTSTQLFERVRIASCSAAGARILGESGAITTVPLRDLRPMAVHVGDRVHALWQNGDTGYAGVVLATEGRLANVRYEDGSEEWAQPQQVVSVESAGGGGAGACPRGGEDFAMVRRGPLRRVVEVVSCAGGNAVVHAPGDAPSETISLSELRALAVPEGARVEIFWHQSTPYTAWAGATHGGTVDARYDDGSTDAAPLTDVRWIASDFVAEPFLCPAGS
jgi:hypothetical protein